MELGEQVLTTTGSEAPPVDTPQVAETPDDGSDKALASERGWVDKDKYYGNAPWVDAKEYNDRYERVMPVVRKENQRLHSTLSATTAQLAAMQEKIEAMERRAQETDQFRTQNAIASLEAQRAQAMQNQDVEAFTRLDREIRTLERQSGGAVPQRQAVTPNPPAQSANGVAPAHVQAAINDFSARYPMFNADRTLQVELGAEVDRLQRVTRAGGMVLDPSEILERAAKRVMRDNPDLFPNPRGRPAMAETRGAPARSSASQRGWNDLTPDAQEHFDGMIARNKSMTREKLLAAATDDLFKR